MVKAKSMKTSHRQINAMSSTATQTSKAASASWERTPTEDGKPKASRREGAV